METKSNNILVGAVAIAILIGLFAFILWIARFDTGGQKEYDVFFRSVSGLASGSAVNYSGVPVGSVQRIAILPDSPEFVRVRIVVSDDTPILEGTTATLSSVGFTGVAIVTLDGAIRGAPPIVETGQFGVPVIPTKPGTLDSLLNAAPQLLERVSSLTERLTLVLSEDNVEEIGGILENMQVVTAALAENDREIAGTLQAARAALENAGRAADELATLAATSNALMDAEGESTLATLRETLESANGTLAKLEITAAETNDTLVHVQAQTLPEVDLLLRDLRLVSGSLGAVAAKLDEDPAGAILGGRTLPAYDPETRK